MIILDSHIWFWWINQERHRFSETILEAIKSADRVGVSPVSCFELALAHKRGRLALPLSPFEWFRLALYGSDVELLPFNESIALRAVELSAIHRDPFDRCQVHAPWQSVQLWAAKGLQAERLVLQYGWKFRKSGTVLAPGNCSGPGTGGKI